MTKKAHDKIANVIQEIWDEDNIKVKNVFIDWLDLTTGSGYKYSVRKLSIDSETRHILNKV